MKKKIFLLFLLTGISFAGWERTFDWESNDKAYSIIQAFDGGYVVVGGSLNSFTPNPCKVIKLSASGSLLWEKDINACELTDIKRTADNCYIITGVVSDSTDCYDVYVAKLEADGDVIWERAFDNGMDSTYNYGLSVIQTLDGDYSITGLTRRLGSGNKRLLLLKIAGDGDLIYLHEFCETDYYNVGLSILETPEGKLVVFGMKGDMTWSMEFDASGDTTRTKLYSEFGYGCSAGLSICQTLDGCYIASVASPLTGLLCIDGANFTFHGSDIIIAKLSADFDTIWTRAYGLSGSDVGWSVLQTPDGGFIVAGSGEFHDADTTDVYLLKTDEFGDTLWTRRYSHSYVDVGKKVILSPDGGYVIAGYAQHEDYDDDYYIIKTDSLGNVDWVNDFSQKPQEFDLSIYPNPFNSAVRIFVGDERARPAQIEIYDIAGKKVAEIPLAESARQREAQKNRQCRWQPAPSVPSGVYLVRAKIGNSKITKRVIYLK